jgi:hypothetical protein
MTKRFVTKLRPAEYEVLPGYEYSNGRKEDMYASPCVKTDPLDTEGFRKQSNIATKQSLKQSRAKYID